MTTVDVRPQQRESIRARIHNFFEQSSSPFARLTAGFIYALILYSVAAVAIEFWHRDLFLRYEAAFTYGEYLTLAVFSVEYILKVATAPERLRFAVRPMSLVDLGAILPSLIALVLPYLVDTTELRAMRLLRLLRAARMVRVLRLLRIEFFGKLLRFQGTILQAILPILLVVSAVKAAVWVLESLGFWVFHSNLGELFAIVGFALGIILSQKVAATYDKFLQEEDEIVRMTASLSSLAHILDQNKSRDGRKAVQRWAEAFQLALTSPRATAADLRPASRDLFEALAACESGPAELAMKYTSLQETAAYCLGRSKRLTPRPYDSLLQQATVLYLLLLAAFIPGWSGMLSVVVASYVLYGMYYLTQDLDSVLGGEFRLVSIDTGDLQRFVRGEG